MFKFFKKEMYTTVELLVFGVVVDDLCVVKVFVITDHEYLEGTEQIPREASVVVRQKACPELDIKLAHNLYVSLFTFDVGAVLPSVRRFYL